MRVSVNGEGRDLRSGTTVAELVRELGLRSEQVAVELDQRLVRREDHERTVLREDDSVELVTLVGGG